jgi:toxin ParE1/3/4
VSNPGIGRERRFREPSLQGIRAWVLVGFENYLLFYRPLANGIEIVRLLHGARDLEGLFEDPR